jgi:hypothetical protein
MPHTTNRVAFRDCDAKDLGFRLCMLLVAVELALKDSLPRSAPYRAKIKTRSFPVSVT